MAYDEGQADRLRAALAGEQVEERRMFGGLAFLVGGHMSVCVSGQGGLMVRVDPSQRAELLAQRGVAEVVMGGRGAMKGWVRVADEVLGDDAVLEAWVQRGLACVRALPPER